MRRFLVLLTICFVVTKSQAQLKYASDTLVYLSRADSAVFTYIYPVFTLEQAPKRAEMLNTYVKTALLPDPAVFEKLQKINVAMASAIKNKEKQLVRMLVTYENELIVCLQTDINVDIPGNLYEVGDRYFETLSIASGNKYELKNLFTKNIYDTLYSHHEDILSKAGIPKDQLIEQIIGFGLIEQEMEECKNCFVLELILREFYADAGPMPLELHMEDITSCINADGPLKSFTKN